MDKQFFGEICVPARSWDCTTPSLERGTLRVPSSAQRSHGPGLRAAVSLDPTWKFPHTLQGEWWELLHTHENISVHSPPAPSPCPGNGTARHGCSSFQPSPGADCPGRAFGSCLCPLLKHGGVSWGSSQHRDRQGCDPPPGQVCGRYGLSPQSLVLSPHPGSGDGQLSPPSPLCPPCGPSWASSAPAQPSPAFPPFLPPCSFLFGDSAARCLQGSLFSPGVV